MKWKKWTEKNPTNSFSWLKESHIACQPNFNVALNEIKHKSNKTCFHKIYSIARALDLRDLLFLFLRNFLRSLLGSSTFSVIYLISILVLQLKTRVMYQMCTFSTIYYSNGCARYTLHRHRCRFVLTAWQWNVFAAAKSISMFSSFSILSLCIFRQKKHLEN